MDSIFYSQGKLFGIEWHAWKVVGWLGNCIFFSRFLVQWHATERQKKVVVPVMFWWLSLLGSLLLLIYALFYRKDSVFIFAYAFTWIPYIRNLMIHKRMVDALVTCPQCQETAAPEARFCAKCGKRLAAT